MSDGSTLLDRSVREHNMFAASRVFATVTLSSLAEHIGLEPAAAEKALVGMLADGKIQGRLDHASGTVEFQTSEEHDALRAWDEDIKDVCA